MNQNFFKLSLIFLYYFFFKACGSLNYGYGCNESCQCSYYSVCNASATNINDSCICNQGYAKPFCNNRIDTCGKNVNIYINKIFDLLVFLFSNK